MVLKKFCEEHMMPICLHMLQSIWWI